MGKGTGRKGTRGVGKGTRGVGRGLEGWEGD